MPLLQIDLFRCHPQCGVQDDTDVVAGCGFEAAESTMPEVEICLGRIWVWLLHWLGRSLWWQGGS